MKVIIHHTSDRELKIDAAGETESHEWYDCIPDVLDDPTADREERTRTIIAAVGDGGCKVRENFDVFVFNDKGDMTFSGSL